MVDFKKLAKDVGNKTKDVAVAAGKQAGIGLSEEEKDLAHKKKLHELQKKAEMEEAKLQRQSTNNELRARIAESKQKFNANKPESGFDRIKKTIDGMKSNAQADTQRQDLNKPVTVKVTNKKMGMSSGGVNFEQMLGMGGASNGNFDDMLGGLKSKSKKSKQRQGQSFDEMLGGRQSNRKQSGQSFDEMLGMGPSKKKGKKNKRPSWDDMMGGGMF